MERQRATRSQRRGCEGFGPFRRTLRWRSAIAIAGLLAVVATGGCLNGEPAGQAEPAPKRPAPAETSVTVRGDVGRVLGLHAFEVAQNAGEPVLVVVIPPGEVDVAPGHRVEVTGTPRRFEVAAFESDFGLNLENETYAPLEGRHCLVVNDVKVLPRVPAVEGRVVTDR